MDSETVLNNFFDVAVKGDNNHNKNITRQSRNTKKISNVSLVIFLLDIANRSMYYADS